MRARLLAGALALGIALGAAAPAAAHVSVLPESVTVNEAEEFTVRVPNERDLPTTRVQVTFPSAISVYSFAAPPPGFTMRPLLTADGRNRGVVYTGRIPAGQYADFEMLGTGFDAGEARWPVVQTYADGQAKPWTGPPEQPGAEDETGPTTPGPAPVTTVLAAGAAPAPPAGPAVGDDGDDSSGAGIWLGVIAIGISALAALGVGLLWSSRPARLPPDEPGDSP